MWHLKTPATLLPPIWPLIPPSKECGDCEENHELPDNLKLLHPTTNVEHTHTHASATHNMLLSRVTVSLKRLLRAKRSRLELPPGWTLSTDFHPILMQVSPHIHFTLSDVILSKFPHPCTPHTPQTYSKMYDSSDHFFNTIIDVFMPSTFCSDKVT